MKMFFTEWQSPIGRFYIASSEKGLVQLNLRDKDHFSRELHNSFPDADLVESEEKNQLVIRQLNEYFAGERKEFSVPLHLNGTEFHQRVWRALCEIPFGKTASYKEIAERIGNPKAMRAVGQANHRNPIPIIIPCHRVIGANGHLTGYGGGMDMKEKLLSHEGVALNGSKIA